MPFVIGLPQKFIAEELFQKYYDTGCQKFPPNISITENMRLQERKETVEHIRVMLPPKRKPKRPVTAKATTIVPSKRPSTSMHKPSSSIQTMLVP